MAGRIVVGTSSWADPGFVEEWYPSGLPARDRLPWYAERFEAVEVNSTFYAVPGSATVRRWAEVTPPGFTFDLKLHKLLSRHAAGLDSLPAELRAGARTSGRGRVRLDAALEAALAGAVLEAVEPLEAAGKLATFLLQLSPAFSPHEHRLDELEGLLERLAPRPVALELRHRSWVREHRLEATLEWLEAHGVAWVCTDMPAGEHMTIMPPLDAVTRPDVAYLRAHGRNLEGYVRGRSVAERFAHRYSDAELEELRERALGLAEDAREVRVMFNNNRGADAPVAAARMRELLGQVEPGPAPGRAAEAGLSPGRDGGPGGRADGRTGRCRAAGGVSGWLPLLGRRQEGDERGDGGGGAHQSIGAELHLRHLLGA